ncbi:Ig-like domain-containing protein [Mycobacterium sp. CVI_P3]|uniref:1-phosphatidylinositol phosphodiesterase n=1 Tax=Mycobacterium pinniadriaticum TaxID=2994102 RepID=A0ABT3SPJ6_9MYCO|nr:phosphatidylinositol-specific phospholipase C domain-containing protein [Mycobacterium pinniadriaticum]MCX2934676.1 Ig-like domain-containing protein [Mycobacterium pinniadriaticum]MCX2941098.1 Ig-like domain-containing protein [Mycobacterium pinniadriaticum]
MTVRSSGGARTSIVTVDGDTEPAAASSDQDKGEASSPVESSDSAAPSSPSRVAVARPINLEVATPPVFKAASDVLTAMLGGGAPAGAPSPAPSPALWTLAASARREIGVVEDVASPVSPVAASRVVAAAAVAVPDVLNPGSWQGWISGVITQIEADVQAAQVWVSTYVNLRPWYDGSLLPAPLRPIFFHATPVAGPMQVELDLADGETSDPITFTATDADGTRLLYSVPDKGMPGGPSHGTVVVDNATGTFTYTPDETFTGTDSFAFIASDATSIHFHAWADLVNAAFGILDTGLLGGHRDTATVTIFNNVDIKDVDTAQYTDVTGDFSVLTYNVADSGLLNPVAAVSRLADTLAISTLLNKFDVVNVQEDVSYHMALLAKTVFPDQTAPQIPSWLGPVGALFSDGLNTFSAFRIESLSRQEWDLGQNPLTPDGFTYSRIHIPGGSSIDLYNIDTNGGSVTNADLEQLSTFIQTYSIGRAVIVMGDFGQLYSDAGQTLSQFAADNGLTDAWVESQYGGVTPADAPSCAYDNDCEQPDKVFYRDAALLDPNDPLSSPVQLTVSSYVNEGLNFLSSDGTDLSDHRPVSVTFSYSLDAIGPQNVDPENWMATLPGIDTLPFTQLPIPGSHDSGSYGIVASAPWALTGISDFGVLAQLPPLIEQYIVKPIAAAWSKTQSEDILGQLNEGVRYLDLRLSNEPDGNIYIEHGLRGPSIDVVLQDIADFAYAHPQEVIVVYAQRFTNFDTDTHAEFVDMLNDNFGDRMAPASMTTSATLQDYWAIDKNIIVVYNNSATVAGDPNLWADSTLYRPWPNTPSMQELLVANWQNYDSRPAGSIWGMFGEPTENVTNIVMGILWLGTRSLEEFMANAHPYDQQWIRVDFKDKVNLVTADWFDTSWPAGSEYFRDVIAAAYETLDTRLAVNGSAL